MLGSTNAGGNKPGRPGRKRNRFALSFDGSNDHVDTGLTQTPTLKSLLNIA